MTDLQQKVYHYPDREGTITMFAYGNGYRVKAEVVDLDPHKTKLLAGWDQYFENELDAQAKFDKVCENAAKAR